jgi:hypothetical protein
VIRGTPPPTTVLSAGRRWSSGDSHSTGPRAPTKPSPNRPAVKDHRSRDTRFVSPRGRVLVTLCTQDGSAISYPAALALMSHRAGRAQGRTREAIHRSVPPIPFGQSSSGEVEEPRKGHRGEGESVCAEGEIPRAYSPNPRSTSYPEPYLRELGHRVRHATERLHDRRLWPSPRGEPRGR